MGRKRKKKTKAPVFITLVLLVAIAVVGYAERKNIPRVISDILQKGNFLNVAETKEIPGVYIEPALIPSYQGKPFVELNDNIPNIDMSDGYKEFEIYSERDALGRCRSAYANVSYATMPDKERESIGMIKPTGWHLVKYEGIDGDFLYNRCHLIGYQLTGEGANPNNLITGTRYLNIEGMLPFENLVADYVKRTGYHVLYKVTPVFTGSNMLADGVWIQAASVEDKTIHFSVFCYNVQPGIKIDYTTGESTSDT